MKSRRTRRTRIEWLKAEIAFVVFIVAVGSVDSEIYIIPMAVALWSLLYLRVVAIRLWKRGEF